jgi:hypothetical protein
MHDRKNMIGKTLEKIGYELIGFVLLIALICVLLTVVGTGIALAYHLHWAIGILATVLLIGALLTMIGNELHKKGM